VSASRAVKRRRFLIGGLAAALGIGASRSASGSASQPKTAVDFVVPRGACDCHVHVFGDPQRFPMWTGRTYTPEMAPVQELSALHRALHVSRTVIVTPLVYGTDNACTVDALRRLWPNARAIALIDDHSSSTELDELDRAGVRGIRLNFESFGVPDPQVARDRFRRALEQLTGRNWHIQIYARLVTIDALHDAVMASPVPVVIDHFGQAQASLGTIQANFAALLSLVGAGKAYAKMSAAYRISNDAPDYANVAPLARALVAANPQRILWGTDWPHPDSSQNQARGPTDIAPLYEIDDGRLFNQFPVWVPDAHTRKMILVDNPQRLYRF
jgi:predicted TIM-barrel fold metal-dependent hydrolase